MDLGEKSNKLAIDWAKKHAPKADDIYECM